MGRLPDRSFLHAYQHGTLVIWPPDNVRRVVNSLRRHYDPASASLCAAHITLTWPFLAVPSSGDWQVIDQIASATEQLHIQYGPLGSFLPYPCVYLQIEPASTVRQLHTDLHATGLFDDSSPLTGENFVPHMSITDGYPDPVQTRLILDGLQGYEPAGVFCCQEISWIVPDTSSVFQIRRSIPLGG